MKIKDEYIGAKISHKGNRITLDANRYEYFVSIGLGYMFEEYLVKDVANGKPFGFTYKTLGL